MKQKAGFTCRWKCIFAICSLVWLTWMTTLMAAGIDAPVEQGAGESVTWRYIAMLFGFLLASVVGYWAVNLQRMINKHDTRLGIAETELSGIKERHKTEDRLNGHTR